MFKIKIGVLLAAVVAVFAVSAAPAMSFTEFVQKAAKSGNQDKGGKQVFKTSAGTVECEEAKSNGGSIVEKSTQAFSEVKYEKCKAFGFPTTISPARYNFHAQGKVTIQNTILINVEKGLCEVEVGPTGNKELGTITYTNNSPGVTLKAAVTGITYNVIKSTKGVCGATGSQANGKYEGEAKTETYKGELCQYVGPGGAFKNSLCTEAGSGEWEKQVGYTTLEVH